MDIFVCKGLSGEIHRVHIDPDEPVQQQLSKILKTINLTGLNDMQVGIYNLTQDFEYVLEKSFAEQNTKMCDLLLIADGSICHK